jgi:AraC-like DNA-binding protein
MASSQPHLKFANLADPQVFGFFAQFHANVELGSSLLERQSCLAACIRILLERCAEAPLAIPRSPRVHPRIEKAREFIQEHFRDAISLDDLATAASLSRYHLVRAFTSAYGLPPHAFQIHVRVAKARPLLVARIAPAVVAADMGFADQSHFTRHFRQICGTTPGNYARAAR